MIHYITTNGVGDAWVVNELGQLKREGIPFKLHAMRRPQQYFFDSAWALCLKDATNELYPISLMNLLISLLLAPFLFEKRFFLALCNALFGQRESQRARIACLAHFFVACCWSRQLRSDSVSHIHSQWAHSCGSIGMYGAWLLGISFSFTGHAADLFRDRVALRDKIRRAEFIICISTFHHNFYLDNGAKPEQLAIAYCGVNINHFKPGKRSHSDNRKPRICSSGRLVEKKGFIFLIDACRELAGRGLNFECVIAGSGPLESDLRARIAGYDLNEQVFITGTSIRQDEIPQFMRRGQIYCLPCVRAKDGDIDGLPQMLMEAMACGLPVISTNLVGIPDLVIDGQTGILVDPGDISALAVAIESLLLNADRSAVLAEAGRHRVESLFDIERSLEPLLARFREKTNIKANRSPNQVSNGEHLYH